MRREGTPGEADWGSYDPDEQGICYDCGRELGDHAGTACFAPNAAGLPTPTAPLDYCPDCAGTRVELRVAPGRFYCERCCKTGPGPVRSLIAAQLTLGGEL